MDPKTDSYRPPTLDYRDWNVTGMREHVAIMALIILLPAAFIIPAKGVPIDVTIAPTQVTLRMNLSLQENITSLPLVSVDLNSSGSKSTVDRFNLALQRLVPGASIASFSLHARTVNASKSWFLSENYTMTIVGANADSGGAVKSNLGFLSMSVPGGMAASGLELNTIGETYLLANLTSQPPNTGYFINGNPTLNSVIPAQTTAPFYLLDFTWVPAISTWSRQDDLISQSTVWTYNPGSPRFNLTFGPKSPEPPLLLKSFTAVYNPSFQLSVPANAWSAGTTVYFDLSTPSELVMLVIIFSLALVLGVALILDRNVSRTRKLRAKKR
jgi:hypothetical protein